VVITSALAASMCKTIWYQCYCSVSHGINVDSLSEGNTHVLLGEKSFFPNLPQKLSSRVKFEMYLCQGEFEG
jgi:hypothetical protein